MTGPESVISEPELEQQIEAAPRRPGEPMPVSASQERLWLLDRTHPGTAAYSEPHEIRLRGSLEESALAAALGEIVHRHEVLRTVYREHRGKPVQIVQLWAGVPLPRVDLSGLPEAAREAAGQFARQAAVRPFDLEQGPMLRALLLRLNTEEHVLLLQVHHIATDGGSSEVLDRELVALYRRFAVGGPPPPALPPLPPLPLQYADFAVWQQRWLAGPEAALELAAWSHRLAGLPAVLELPTDRPRAIVQSFRGAIERTEVTPDLEAPLEALGHRAGATFFMILLAAFQTLLHRITGCDDLAVGVPAANRNRPELQGLIGGFANSLVLRTDLAGDPSFGNPSSISALGRVREAALFAYAHQELPFERLVAELAPEADIADIAHAPIFQVLLSLAETPPQPLGFGPDLRGEVQEVHNGAARLDLALGLSRHAEGLTASLEYASDLFDQATAARLLAMLRALLEGIAALPEARLSELPLLSPAEREQVLYQWNQTESPIQDLPVHRLFEAHARRAPEALAVSWSARPEDRMTYGELDRRASRLAGRLRRLGMGPESVVAVLFERSPELVLAVLATTKAGGAWLPIDPAYPGERIAAMVRDSGAVALLTTPSEILPEIPLPPERVLRLNSRDPEDAAEDEGEVQDAVDEHPDHLAYVIYTSGSTGTPKGTELKHRGLANLVGWHQRTYEPGPADRSPLLAGPGFDASVWEMWPALAAGASLHVPPQETLLSPAALLAWLVTEGITVAFLPTPLAEALLAEWQAAPPPELALRALLTGGDRLLRRPPPDLPFTLVNHYGPTESTVVATAGVVAATGGARNRLPDIGSAIDNTRVYLLDRSLRLVPLGVSGELCIAGEGLARGYRGRPDLTAERFVPNPVNGEPGERLYRTGDLARRLAGGGIEFLGRIDHQVKIRGIRIELGEIESALAAQPEVAAAAVLVRDEGPGSRRLAGYVVAPEISGDELRARLARRLPAAMVPSAWVFLDALPLTPNGKVDRAALARIPPAEPTTAARIEPPRTPGEQLLADLFREVLALDHEVGAQDDFFQLGGHSLLVFQLASRMRAVLGMDVELRTVFEHSTVAGLAGWLADASHDGRAATATIAPASRGAESPLSFAQQRLWFLDRFESGETALYNVAVAFHLLGPGLRVPPLASALDEIARRHEALRTVFRDSAAGTPVQVVQPTFAGSLPVIDLSALPDARAAAACLESELAVRPFDLVRGPLLRCCLLRLGSEEHHLVVAIHHIASDRWSIDVLVREVSELYQAYAQDLPSPLPPLPLQYADFAIWQRHWLAGEVLEAELAWWRERLAGLPPALELPADRPRPPRQSFRGDLRDSHVEPRVAAGLGAVSRRHGATLFMTLAAAFYSLLTRYTGEEDLAVGTPIAGRNRVETAGLIGFFVNTLVLRTSVSGDPTFLELLARARTTALDAFAHQDLPFEQLVAELAPQRDLARTPLFQVMFAAQETPAPKLHLDTSLTGSMVELQTATAKFDLYLQVARDGDGLRPNVEYALDLFDTATVDRLLGHLGMLLEGVVATPETRISELPLLTGGEREQLRSYGTGSEPVPLPPSAVLGLFESQARRAPEALAVSWSGGSMTYGELDRRANHLGHRLRGLGVRPESVVAILLERSAETVIAVVATVKAGGAWLPIDPVNPGERIATMLRDSGAAVLLTVAAQLARVPDLPLPPERVLRLDGEGFPDESAAPPTPFTIDPDHLAYVIYTSGSTGVPKGAALTYRGLANLVDWDLRAFERGPEDRAPLLSGPGFDASVWEIWATLAAGASLHVPPRETILSPPALLAWLAAERITLIFLATPLGVALLEEIQAAPLPPALALRTLLTGGDRLVRRPWPELTFPLFNIYGPTETTVYATLGIVTPTGSRVPHIGTPLDNTRVHLVDRHLRPVPVGLPGELCITGAGLARGYLARPELTAERFVPNPLAAADAPGQRMYRTGDLARWLPGGEIEFLGRIDHQVKIRGIRIELGEIESVLAAQPEVAAAVVMMREDAMGDRRLVAYIVAPGGIGQAELRERLARRLPAAMVPAGWIFLDALPLNPNGKLDRRALERIAPPEPEAGAATDGSADAPQTPIEQLLADLVREVLKLPRPVSSHDDFFHLGGHSLLVVQLASRAAAVFGVDVDIRTVFDHPTVAGLAGWIAEAIRGGRPATAPIVPVARGAESPLSFAQQRLWFLDRFESGGTALYNVPVAFHLAGPGLRVAALAGALDEVVRRHETLRTVFRESADGEPVQVVQPFITGSIAGALPVIDLSGLPDARSAAGPVERELADRPFDLARGPLLRCCLLRLGAEEHHLVVSTHHVASDGWSLEVLVREISELYQAYARALPSPLPPLPVQYADFAIWQRRWLAGEVIEAELAWWRERLAGLPPALELPADRPRPARQSFRGGLRHSHVEPQTGAGLAALGRRHGATLFMTLTAAFYTLLCRYTGEEDLVLGTPIAGRNHAETEGLIGFFVNTLVLRTSLAGDVSFPELLARVRMTALDAYAHQDLPFEQLVAELAPQRDLARTPLFQVLFALREVELPELYLGPGLAGPMIGLQTTTAKFDLSLQVSRNGDELRSTAEYATDLFDAATIDRLLAHLGTLLAGIAAAPETPLSLLPLLAGGELEQLRSGWSGAEPVPLPATTLHGLFTAQAARAPGDLAVVCGPLALTYAELERRSARLAQRLRRLGVGPEVPVGVCLSRTPDLVVALLAVLRAGGFYVPLDPAYPAERLAYMVADSGCRVVLTEEALAAVLPPASLRLLRLDDPLETAFETEPQDEAGAVREPRVLPQNLAYLIYTSGSTGRPKAVAIEHRSAALLAGWAREVFSPAELAGVLASTSIAFDLSVFEIFVPLAWGGTVILVENALALPALKAPGALPPGVEVRLVNTVPSAAAELLGADGLPPTVSTINLAGEALSRALARRAYQRPHTERLYNLYGPSEDTTYSTFALIDRSPERTPPIGRPVDGTRAYVLDRRLQPAPVGVPGELYLAGGGLARGYLGRPELTAERFLPDPLADTPGARMYRTGDLTIRRAGGELDYLGRIDRQVKVRGFRIELGEVEAAIAAHPGVRAVVAVVREDQPGDRRLVAYVVADSAEVTPQALRQAVQARLPEAMTPSLFIFLDALPLSPNGKVDLRALPAPEPLAAAGHELIAPRTHLEERVADLWRTVLKVDRLGIHDSFWELGGHSLLATRLAYRVRESFGVELPVRTLFENPTLAGYAAAIAEALRRPGERTESMAPRTGSGPAPLSHAQQRLWFLDRLQPGLAVYNLPVQLGIAGPLVADSLAAALSEIVRRHGVLRTTFAVDAESGEPVQIVAEPVPWPLPRVDLAGLPTALGAAEAERLLAAERRLPFDLARGPLLRSLLVRLGPQEHRLALTMHHAISDGWSIGVLRRELQALYGAAVTGRPSPLPELAVQYADFSVWQRHWLAGGEWESQLAWWRQTLAGVPPTLDLPTDRPRPAVQSLRGDTAALPLSEELSAALTQLGRRRGTTPFMTLLAAFEALLFRYTSQEDLWVGTPIANRRHAETENLLGFFVNTLVLRLDLRGDPTFDELLGRVRETALAAYAHQDLPFEKLVEELAPERDLSRTPLFQVLFATESERPAAVELAPGVTLEMLPVDLGASKFDLSLAVEPGPEGLEATVEWATDLFDAATMRRLLSHFRSMLTEAAGNPATRISELPLLTAEEREEVVAFGRRAAAPILETPVQQLFEAHARRAPEALAVSWSGGSMTYGELDRRANQLAHHLRGLGVRPESVVAILLERSPELVIAVLATAKAGGAWLPIDPVNPGERIATMLRDSGAVALLTAAAPLAGMADLPLPRRRVLRLDGAGFPTESTTPTAAVALDPDHLAYIIYTSGSTGMPKGTELGHRGLANLAGWHQRTYELGPADRSTLLAGPGFDASVWEMWPALTAGASLHVPPAETILSPAALLAWLVAERITVAFLPTPLAEALLEEAQTAPQPGLALRVLLTGGDRLLRRPSPDLPFALVNHYGPTESTVVATAGIVTATGTRAPDIGAAIANSRVYLVDRILRPVPVGLPGELCIAGAGLARGYRGRPELTAERFVPNPLDTPEDGPGERLYRTGDLARWLPGGLIEFLGRIDHQVKIRGVRIELSEIESVLAAQPEVAAAVVVVVGEEETGDRRLVAYVVAPAGPGVVGAEELRERLARRLPAAMVPAAWVFLDALPLTPNGKVDRRALPAPEPSRAEHEFIAPRTPLEEQVADIWRTVLRVDRVGIDDNFWDLGGHSLIATKVLARVRDTFGIDLPLQSLFTTPRLAEFAAAVGQGVLSAQELDAADLLAELDGLSEDEIRALLAAEA